MIIRPTEEAMFFALPRRYDRCTIALHWASAALVLFMWCSAHVIDWFHRGVPRADARSVHIVTGVCLLGLIMLRIGWRLTKGTQIPSPGVLQHTAKFIHLLLYGMVLGTLGLGLFNAWVRGDSLFGLGKVPAYGTLTASSRHALAERLTDLHGLGANALVLLAIGHGIIALYHHFILHDGVLRRMTWQADSPR